MVKSAAFEEARSCREQLLARLDEESETDLADYLRRCGETLILICPGCGYHHPTEKRCKKKWCPVCVRALSTKRALKFSAAARRMRWPLHLTLTVQNITNDDDQFIRRLRRNFGKLRHRKLWKNSVAGGVAGIEVTNKGKGWHPHIHALIDCRWLAISTPQPQAGESKRSVRAKCRRAKREFTKLWCKIIKEKWGVCYIRRVDNIEKAVREVLKYAISGTELAEVEGNLGPLIRQLDGCRLTTSFGSMFGKKLVADEPERVSICPGCKQPTDWFTEDQWNREFRR